MKPVAHFPAQFQPYKKQNDALCLRALNRVTPRFGDLPPHLYNVKAIPKFVGMAFCKGMKGSYLIVFNRSSLSFT